MTDVDALIAQLEGSPDLLGALLEALPQARDLHPRGSEPYQRLAELVRPEVERRFQSPEPSPQPMGPFGELVFPYHRMGAVDSLNLFDLDELIIFSFYWATRGRYARAADVGANLGLHSCLLARAGCEVRSYEPDPVHFELLQSNLSANGCERVAPVRRAISSAPGQREFVRVLGNTTGSHLSGAKANPYGELERFEVEVEGVGELLAWADLLKIDAEGEEAEILCGTRAEDWVGKDALIEVGSSENARAIWEHFREGELRLFAQKLAWARVVRLEDMPTSYRDGTLFLTRRAEMPWSAVDGA